VQRNLEGPRHLKAVDLFTQQTVLSEVPQKRQARLIDDIPVPAGLNKSDTSRGRLIVAGDWIGPAPSCAALNHCNSVRFEPRFARSCKL
jgi:hypothetical protein